MEFWSRRARWRVAGVCAFLSSPSFVELCGRETGAAPQKLRGERVKTAASGALRRICSLPAVDSVASVNSSASWRSGSFKRGCHHTSQV